MECSSEKGSTGVRFPCPWYLPIRAWAVHAENSVELRGGADCLPRSPMAEPASDMTQRSQTPCTDWPEASRNKVGNNATNVSLTRSISSLTRGFIGRSFWFFFEHHGPKSKRTCHAGEREAITKLGEAL